MTTLNSGDKVLLPEWLGGGEAIVCDRQFAGAFGALVIRLFVYTDDDQKEVFVREQELVKAPTPEPTDIGHIHTDKDGESYVLMDSGNRGWRAVGLLKYAWEEISR